jgi:type II secretory pathway pseudopilin PulG
MRLNQRGISLVELMVVIIMTGFMVTLVSAFMINYWRYGYMLESDLDTLGTRLTSGDVLRDSVGTSSGLIMQNSLSDAHVGVVDPGDPTGTHWQIIHAVPGTQSIGSGNTITPLIYYRRPSVSTSGAYVMNGVQPYEDEYILYLDASSKSLKMRVLANPDATGNKAKTTCPPASATTTCPADKIIAKDLTSVAMRYFSRTGNTIDYTSITDPNTGLFAGPDFTAVEVVEFKLNLSKKPFLQQTNSTINNTIIRVALRNA